MKIAILSIFFRMAVKEHCTLVSFSHYNTACPRSPDPFYLVSYNINWVKTFWTYSRYRLVNKISLNAYFTSIECSNKSMYLCMINVSLFYCMSKRSSLILISNLHYQKTSLTYSMIGMYLVLLYALY